MAESEKGMVRDRIIEQFENLKAHEKGIARSSQWQMISSVRAEIEDLLRSGYTAVQIHRAISGAGIELSYDNLCSFIRPWVASVRASEPGYPDRRRKRRAASATPFTSSTVPTPAAKDVNYDEMLNPDDF